MVNLLDSKKATIALITLALIAAEALVKAFVSGFPFVEAGGFEVSVALGFIGLQMNSDIKEARYGCTAPKA